MTSTSQLPLSRWRKGLLAGAAACAVALLSACGDTTADSPGAHDAGPAATAASTAAFNDADLAFVQQMIPHHQSAITMAAMATGHAGDPRVTQLATAIKSAQQPEIDTMNRWLAAWGKPMPSASAGGDAMGGMDHGDMAGIDELDMTALMNAEGPVLLDTVTDHPGPLAQARAVAASAQAAGRTAVVVLVDGLPAGVLALADRIRPAAPATVSALTMLTGTRPVLLTGDNPGAAARLADEAGISDVHAGLMPVGKVEHVHTLQAGGRRVLLVGDGVNDAPALAAADLGVAMGARGSDLALSSADAVLVRDDLAALPTAIALSRRARRLVVANLVIAGTFITVLVCWDLFGHLPLPLGVAGHEGSTVIVGLNGLRLLSNRAWRRAPGAAS
ncbi:HAD-IC family P-type ATPase [Actinoplanes sp. NPDC020271]|uniref:HAD-IC family P-type ATPase n=1 Tax=Actinoplanes sp. NPDC020271 TaxID=3363896 RepID=UPI0037A8305E